MDWTKEMEAEALFDNFDDELTLPELWDYSEFLVDNNLHPTKVKKFPRKIELFFKQNKRGKEYILAVLTGIYNGELDYEACRIFDKKTGKTFAL